MNRFVFDPEDLHLQYTFIPGFARPIEVPTLETLLKRDLEVTEHPSIIGQVVRGEKDFNSLVQNFEDTRKLYCALYPNTPEAQVASIDQTNALVKRIQDMFRAWAAEEPRSGYGTGESGFVGPVFEKPKPEKPQEFRIVDRKVSDFFYAAGPGAKDFVGGELVTFEGKVLRAQVGSDMFGGKSIWFVPVG